MQLLKGSNYAARTKENRGRQIRDDAKRETRLLPPNDHDCVMRLDESIGGDPACTEGGFTLATRAHWPTHWMVPFSGHRRSHLVVLIEVSGRPRLRVVARVNQERSSQRPQRPANKKPTCTDDIPLCDLIDLKLKSTATNRALDPALRQGCSPWGSRVHEVVGQW